MPIKDGKYKNPNWVNGGPPAIDADELNAISSTLESLDAAGGTGGDGKRYARIVIGTSTNGWTAADCDYLCDGTADNVQILDAINALPAVGGEIVFLDGNYNLSGDIQLPASTPDYFLQISGNGENTVINGNKNTLFWENYGGGNNYTSIKFINIATSSLKFNSIGFGSVSFVDSFLTDTGTGSSGYISPSISNCVIKFTSQFRGTVFQTIDYGDTSSPLKFCNNLVYIPVDFETSIVDGAIGCVISGNVFIGAKNSTGSAFSIANGNATGNVLINCSGGVAGFGVASGNTVIRGMLSASYKSTLSCNCITDGYIELFEGVTVSGNNISQSAESQKPCIRLSKWRNNEEDNTYSTIIGNTCIGGTIGILLDTPNIMPIKTKSNACITGNTCTAPIPLQINSNWSNCLVTGNQFPNGDVVDDGTNNIIFNGTSGGQVILTTSGWSANTQTVTAPGVTVSNYVTTGPTPTAFNAAMEAGVYCSGQGNGTLTFTCTKTPSGSITYTYTAQEVL